jgi:uncharacterized protein YdeI (YjbR/CyaY-like superfamily)
MELETAYKGTPTTYAPDAAAWRAWLAAHHATATSVWLILFNKSSAHPSVTYDQSVDEALCFGWIDSKANKRDAHSRYQFFSKRKPKSNWSQVNKAKVARLEAEGKIAPAGRAMIDLAKATGTWNALDSIYGDTLPDDLQAAFDAQPQALAHWNAFPKSTRNGILEWILNAKRPETRQKRIDETVRLAADNIRANQYRP